MKNKKTLSLIAIPTMVIALGFFFLNSYGVQAQQPLEKKYTLYGNASGTAYCCCSGTSTCGAKACSDCGKT